MKHIIDLQGKNILVTGAGSGIGRETAIVASDLGARMILVDISEEGLSDTLSQIKSGSDVSYSLDLSDSEAVARLIDDAVSVVGSIHGLVHCAGISSRKPLNVLSKKGFGKVMEVNFFSFVDLVRQLSKKKNLADGGSIVVMSSISSVRGYKAKSEYCVSKASVDAFVRCMALELADRRIRINSVMAAEVLTPLAMKAREINLMVGADDFHAPLGPSDPYEVANTIAFLLSDATKTITGTSILIDGGACV